MYVIFPADEVVFLSYDRLIYVPSANGNESSQSQSIRQILENPNYTCRGSAASTSINSSRSITGSGLSRSESCRSAPNPSTCPPPVRPVRAKKKSISFGAECRDDLPRRRSVESIAVPSEPIISHQHREALRARIGLARSLEREKSYEPNEKDNSPSPIPRHHLHQNQNQYQHHNHLQNNNQHQNQSPHPQQYLQPPRERRRTPRKEPASSSAVLLLNGSVDRENSPRAKGEREFLPVGAENSWRGASVSWGRKSAGESSTGSETKQPTPEKKLLFGSIRRKRSAEVQQPWQKMAATAMESPLRELTHPSHNETLKAHNAVTFKLVRTVSDFTQQLGQFYEQHAEELQLLVSNFKKKNLELRKERPACPSSLFHTWETLLQEVEIDAQALNEVASIFGRQISRPLLERSFFRKMQSRKVFTHRESYETIVAKTEEKLAKCRQDYKTAYVGYLSAPTTESLSAYFNNHNAYVQQLHATNGMLEEYGKETLPQLLQELDEIYTDLCSSVSESILQGAEVVSARASERQKRYDSLVNQCRAVSGSSDLANLVRSLPVPQGRGLIIKRPFVPPQPPPQSELHDGNDQLELQNDNIPPPLKDELVIDRLSAVQVQPAHDALRKEASDLEIQIRQIHDSLENLIRIQQRSLESSLYNKVNELQEDISMKRFDLRVAQIHLSAIKSQKELFIIKLEGADATGNRERKMSTVSTGSMKTKWLKAFKSLKTPPPTASPKEIEKKNGSAANKDVPRTDPDAHSFLENTYKKITPCDVCSQILRGHTRQGLKCRFCKMNIHVDCQEKAPKCQPKSRLLRRQKSTSEIESKVPEATPEEENRRRGYIERVQGASVAEGSSMRRRLFAGMKSLTGFGSRSRQGSPGHRSISLPEKRHSQDASGTRPFGEPLCLIPQIENGNGHELPPTPPSPSKGKLVNSKGNKSNKK